MRIVFNSMSKNAGRGVYDDILVIDDVFSIIFDHNSIRVNLKDDSVIEYPLPENDKYIHIMEEFE